MPGERKFPVSILIARAIAGRLLERKLPRYAAAVLLSFDCLLRPKEAVNLKFGDCYKTPAGWYIAMKGRDKTRTQATILCDDRHAVRVLEGWAASGAKSTDRLVTRTYEAYFKAFKEATVHLGLQEFTFSPHGLRHGGAVDRVFCRNQAKASVKAHGRWKAQESFNNYLEIAKANELDVNVSKTIKDKLYDKALRLAQQSKYWKRSFLQYK